MFRASAFFLNLQVRLESKLLFIRCLHMVLNSSNSESNLLFLDSSRKKT